MPHMFCRRPPLDVKTQSSYSTCVMVHQGNNQSLAPVLILLGCGILAAWLSDWNGSPWNAPVISLGGPDLFSGVAGLTRSLLVVGTSAVMVNGGLLSMVSRRKGGVRQIGWALLVPCILSYVA